MAWNFFFHITGTLWGEFAICELKWSGGWSTGTVDWLSASERGQYLEGCPAMNTKCLVPVRFLPDLILWSFENCSHGSPVLVPPWNTVIRLGWSRIGLAVLILHAAGVGLTDRPAVISGPYNNNHWLQLQNYYIHFPPLQHTHIHANTIMRNWSWEWSLVSRHCMLAVAEGILCDRVKRPIGH